MISKNQLDKWVADANSAKDYIVDGHKYKAQDSVADSVLSLVEALKAEQQIAINFAWEVLESHGKRIDLRKALPKAVWVWSVQDSVAMEAMQYLQSHGLIDVNGAEIPA